MSQCQKLKAFGAIVLGSRYASLSMHLQLRWSPWLLGSSGPPGSRGAAPNGCRRRSTERYEGRCRARDDRPHYEIPRPRAQICPMGPSARVHGKAGGSTRSLAAAQTGRASSAESMGRPCARAARGPGGFLQSCGGRLHAASARVSPAASGHATVGVRPGRARGVRKAADKIAIACLRYRDRLRASVRRGRRPSIPHIATSWQLSVDGLECIPRHQFEEKNIYSAYDTVEAHGPREMWAF